MVYLEKPRTSRQVSVGDVITSPHFSNGHQGNPGEYLLVGGSLKGKAFDQSRGTAKYVVITAYMMADYNHTGMSSMPDGWFVVARRLNKRNKDDGKGETIAFHQFFLNGSSNYGVVKEVTVVATMTQLFV